MPPEDFDLGSAEDGDVEAVLARAKERVDAQDFEGACAILDLALRTYPDHAGLRSSLGFALFKAGELEGAQAEYEKLFEAYPASNSVRVNLAVVLLRRGLANDAKTLLDAVLDDAPNHRRAQGYLGVALEQLGELDEAQDAFLAGNYVAAVIRLRERHPEWSPRKSIAISEPSSPPQTIARPETRIPISKRPLVRTFSSEPPPMMTASPTAPPLVGAMPPIQVMAARMTDAVSEISIEEAAINDSQMPQMSRAVSPLLDAALASLIVAPRGASILKHANGLVLVGVEGQTHSEGGFAALVRVVHAHAGALRSNLFRAFGVPFVRMTGHGQIVLAPERDHVLLPLRMDADVIHVRQERLAGFDDSLSFDVVNLPQPEGVPISFVRFRGEGVFVLQMERELLALDVRPEEPAVVSPQSLIGWIGELIPEFLPKDHPFTGRVKFSGEGSVLFFGPHGPGATSSSIGSFKS